MQKAGRQVPALGSLVDQLPGRNGDGRRRLLLCLGRLDVLRLEAHNLGGWEIDAAFVQVHAHPRPILLVPVHAHRGTVGQDRVLAGEGVGSQEERGGDSERH